MIEWFTHPWRKLVHLCCIRALIKSGWVYRTLYVPIVFQVMTLKIILSPQLADQECCVCGLLTR